MEKFLDGFFKLFDALVLTNPLAAFLVLLLVGALLGLRRLYNDNATLRAEKEKLLESAPKEKEVALAALQKLHDDRICTKDKEIALLHAQYAELSHDTTDVLHGMQQALVSGNPKKMLASIFNGIQAIGNRGLKIPLHEMGMHHNAPD